MESEPTPVFKPQLDAIIKAADSRLYGDGFNISGRIWRLESDSLDGIRRIVYEGVAKGDSAWRIAPRLESYLGMGRGCPRWGRARLFKLTKSDIASGDRTGLYSGDECAGQGVAYNALRLARNEIQIAHHMATDALWSQMPWIEQERIVLSPAHPKADICDDLVSGGANGDGVYPKGEISLPAHPQCLCFKVAVQPAEQEFTARLRGWLHSGDNWPEMDQYAGFLGTGRAGLPNVSLLVTITRRLAVWLWGDEDALEGALLR